MAREFSRVGSVSRIPPSASGRMIVFLCGVFAGRVRCRGVDKRFGGGSDGEWVGFLKVRSDRDSDGTISVSR